jgi:hypothetical protein
VGKVELTDAEIQPVRLYVVYSRDNKPLQFFKGTHKDALAGGERAYPERKPFTAVEAVDCPAADVQFILNVAQGDWVCTQFAMLAQAMNPIQRVPGGNFRH